MTAGLAKRRGAGPGGRGAKDWLQRFNILMSRGREFAIAFMILLALVIMLAPLSPGLMDLLLGVNILISLLLLLVTIFVAKPLDFSTFPSVLLIITLYRLSLNVATTRLILARGHTGPRAAGDLISTFGQFVAGGGGGNAAASLVVGLTIFAIIILINFIVITKGATRIAEVSARFTLDAMPGQQMAIDADLNAGLIDEQTAKSRREELRQLTDFYGAMDGASKFVRGDAIAGIVVTVVNIAVGFVVGMLIHGMDFRSAGITFTQLTVGDGLVSQIPALLVSVGSGLLVTRQAGRAEFGSEVMGQLFGQPKALAFATLIVGGLGLTGLVGLSPFPPLPLLTVAAFCGVAWYLQRRESAVVDTKAKADKQAQDAAAKDAAKPAPDKVESLLRVDPMSLEVGYGVVPLVDAQQTGQGGGLLGRVQLIRQTLASELGIIVPPIRIRDNIALGQNEYVVSIQGSPVAHGTAEPDKYLAMDSGLASEKVSGIETVEPAFGLPAVWINPADREYAERVGYTVVDAETVVATHLTEVIKERAAELLTREEVKKLLEATKEYAPVSVEEANAAASPGEIQKVLQNLLRERVSIRNLPSILETIGDIGKRVKDPEILTEFVRASLGRWLCNEYAQNGRLHVITFDPRLEEAVMGRLERTDAGSFLMLKPPQTQKLLDAIRAEVHRQLQAGREAVLLVAPQIRAPIKRLARNAAPGSALPRLVVLSYNEIHGDFAVESVGMVTADLTT